MKTKAFNKKFYIDYLFIPFKSAPPLLEGMALGGCGTFELRSSFSYLSKILTDLDKNNSFFYSKKLKGNVTVGNVAL